MKKKVLSVLLSVCLFITLLLPCFANGNENAATQYPYVFVHGMMGWGENTESQETTAYWGMAEEINIPEHLRAQGFEVAVPTCGPLSSAWDRACEVYAQLRGTVVDYGAAHSAEMGHARYGRDYTGRGIMETDWDGVSKINLIGHSFGGPTVTLLTSLLANGAAEEVAADPENCSDLFKGGNNCVYSCTTFDSPHNGTPIANLLYDTKVPVFAIALVMNLSAMSKSPTTDFMMDQWGITADPHLGKGAALNLADVKAVASSRDHAAYDMTLQGAKELQERFPTVKDTYYFSYSADLTENYDVNALLTSSDPRALTLIPSNTIIRLFAGHTVDGIYLDESWAHNDGLVPVPSAIYPQNAENNHADYAEGMSCQKGVWYVMPTYTDKGASHGYGVSGELAYPIYDALTQRIAGLAP